MAITAASIAGMAGMTAHPGRAVARGNSRQTGADFYESCEARRAWFREYADSNGGRPSTGAGTGMRRKQNCGAAGRNPAA